MLNLKFGRFYPYQMLIREARVADVPTIVQLGANVSEFVTSDASDNFWPKNVLIEAVDSDQVAIFVAEVDSEVVGFIIANRNSALSKVLIENIFVRLDRRGTGIASAMMRALIEHSRAGGYRYISTVTPPDDVAAIRTYEKAGLVAGEQFRWLDLPVPLI